MTSPKRSQLPPGFERCRNEHLSIYVTEDTRLLIQGVTGKTGRVLVEQLRGFGTEIVAGVAPQHDGESIGHVPVYGTVAAATRHSPNTSLVAVPAPYVKAACYEAIEAGIDTVVVVSEGVPVHDTLRVISYSDKHGTSVIGPNTLGVISPGVGAAMIAYEEVSKWYTQGRIGVVTRSGSVSTEIADRLTRRGFGQSTVLSVGGDPYLPTPPAAVLERFDADRETDAAVYVGEIGGEFETKVAHAIERIDIPVFASVVGRTAPPEKRMGHAGAIARNDSSDKLGTLERAGAHVSRSPFEIPSSLNQHL